MQQFATKFALSLAVLIAFSQATPLNQETGTIDFDWRGNLQENANYYVSQNQVSWFSANYFCYSNGWDLVSPSNFSAEIELKGFVELFGLTEYNYWAAGNRLADQKTWTWGVGGEKFSLTNWATNQPTASGNNCLLLQTNTTDILWANQDCTSQYNFICQK
ncbi:PREDICTED: lithostathine-2-like [Rhagoletis zephyria]|uniref:lithostathine-2-like n=1 Tax=Rhagoletis zephyria TaxID=28612 RepID=UPI0008116244|nr:PREDICTED: lithostathine-2-like [Rhagoletis zephyria]